MIIYQWTLFKCLWYIISNIYPFSTHSNSYNFFCIHGGNSYRQEFFLFHKCYFINQVHNKCNDKNMFVFLEKLVFTFILRCYIIYLLYLISNIHPCSTYSNSFEFCLIHTNNCYTQQLIVVHILLTINHVCTKCIDINILIYKWILFTLSLFSLSNICPCSTCLNSYKFCFIHVHK